VGTKLGTVKTLSRDRRLQLIEKKWLTSLDNFRNWLRLGLEVRESR
jgi:hypothetical protein